MINGDLIKDIVDHERFHRHRLLLESYIDNGVLCSDIKQCHHLF
jgi:hypothetical protein